MVVRGPHGFLEGVHQEDLGAGCGTKGLADLLGRLAESDHDADAVPRGPSEGGEVEVLVVAAGNEDDGMIKGTNQVR